MFVSRCALSTQLVPVEPEVTADIGVYLRVRISQLAPVLIIQAVTFYKHVQNHLKLLHKKEIMLN